MIFYEDYAVVIFVELSVLIREKKTFELRGVCSKTRGLKDFLVDIRALLGFYNQIEH